MVRENMKKEAVARMKMLNIFPQTIADFEKNDKLSVSEPPMGAFYWLEGEDLDKIHRFEEAHNKLVYCVIRAFTELGTMDAYLYVSEDEDEWEAERADLKKLPNGTYEVCVYVNTNDDDMLSEFDLIGLQNTIAAGLKRVW